MLMTLKVRKCVIWRVIKWNRISLHFLLLLLSIWLNGLFINLENVIRVKILLLLQWLEPVLGCSDWVSGVRLRLLFLRMHRIDNPSLVLRDVVLRFLKATLEICEESRLMILVYIMVPWSRIGFCHFLLQLFWLSGYLMYWVMLIILSYRMHVAYHTLVHHTFLATSFLLLNIGLWLWVCQNDLSRGIFI